MRIGYTLKIKFCIEIFKKRFKVKVRVYDYG